MKSGTWREVPLTAITIGPRFRTDLGDIAALAESIEQVGLLHPIIVTTDYQLVVGRRRLEAHTRLGRTTIAAQVVDLHDPFGAEVDENEQRKAYTPSERVGIGEAREERDKKHAEDRMNEGRKQGGRGKKKLSVNFTESLENGEAREITAKAVGLSWPTYHKAKMVVKAAEEEPEFQELVEMMDRTGNVTRAYNQLPPYAREQPTDDDVPRARKPPRPMTIGAMQVKLDAVVMNIIMPRLFQLADHDVAHLDKLLDFYRELIAQERARPSPHCAASVPGAEGMMPTPSVPDMNGDGTDTEPLAEGLTPASAEEPVPQPQGLLCLWCGGSFSTEEDELRHRAQCGGYNQPPTPQQASKRPRAARGTQAR